MIISLNRSDLGYQKRLQIRLCVPALSVHNSWVRNLKSFPFTIVRKWIKAKEVSLPSIMRKPQESQQQLKQQLLSHHTQCLKKKKQHFLAYIPTYYSRSQQFFCRVQHLIYPKMAGSVRATGEGKDKEPLPRWKVSVQNLKGVPNTHKQTFQTTKNDSVSMSLYALNRTYSLKDSASASPGSSFRSSFISTGCH